MVQTSVPGRLAADLILQRPTAGADRLLLLHHGAGMTPDSMGRIGVRLRAAFPSAWIVSVAAPHVAEDGRGRWWYPIGLGDEGRRRRVPDVLPGFVAHVREWQAQTGIGPAATVLVGFSQGAILSLESMKIDEPPASTVVAFAGRFASLPGQPFAGTVHFLHGEADRIVSCRHSIEGAARLKELGVPVTLFLRPSLGHAVDEEIIGAAIAALTGTGATVG